MRKEGRIVPPRTKVGIYKDAAKIRAALGLADVDFIQVTKILENLHLVIDGYDYEIVERSIMGEAEGLTFPDKLLIKIRDDVYDKACEGDGRARFTIAHELGHLFLHRNLSFARTLATPSTKVYVNSEWQADTFASAFLIDSERITTCRSIEEVMERFGVTRAAAECRFNQLEGGNMNTSG